MNEEIEANIQITREIESEIVKCSEFENALAAKESDLTKTLYVSQFELIGLVTVTSELHYYTSSKPSFLYFCCYMYQNFRNSEFFNNELDDLRSSVANVERELDGMRLKRDETLKRIHENRYACRDLNCFIHANCVSFRLDAD